MGVFARPIPPMTVAGNADHKGLVVLFLLFLAIGGTLKYQLGSRRPAPAGLGAPAGRTPVQERAPRAEPPAPSAIPSPASSALALLPLDHPAGSIPIETYPRPVTTWLEAQIELARRAYSCGPIDGIAGSQSIAALRAFQENAGLPATGQLDAETRDRLPLSAPPLARTSLTAEDLASLQPLSPTWLGKSQQTALAFENALEMVAERTHAHPALIQQLNPGVDWNAITPATKLLAPAVGLIPAPGKAALLHISLEDHALEARDNAGSLIAHFPVSIARDVAKRPAGELHVTAVIPNPDYTFDPEVFPESEEARELGHKLVLPPGPNNPVGIAWIGLDRPGYGIHGTPTPEQVGRTESHGCFRLANWDARTLLDLAWVGLPVIVEP
jgi:lipoprotein-anchoring transpeptidase ErfK/SrfK